MRLPRFAFHAVLGAALGWLPATAPAQDRIGGSTPVIYKWIDEDGIAHYTANLERVPENVRAQAAAAARGRGGPSEEGAVAPRGSRDAERWAVQDAPPRDAEEPGVDAPRLDPGERERAAARAREAERSALDAEIAALEERIARDEEALVELLSDPDDSRDAQLPERSEFREIALRLPKLQAELRALRERRTQLDEP